MMNYRVFGVYRFLESVVIIILIMLQFMKINIS